MCCIHSLKSVLKLNCHVNDLFFNHPLHKLVVISLIIIIHMRQVQICRKTHNGELQPHNSGNKMVNWCTYWHDKPPVKMHQCCHINTEPLTQRWNIHKHEVASLWYDRSHSHVPQDGSQTVPLAFQFLWQWGEVALRLTHKIQVLEHTLGHSFLNTHRYETQSRLSGWNNTLRCTLAWSGVGQVYRVFCMTVWRCFIKCSGPIDQPSYGDTTHIRPKQAERVRYRAVGPLSTHISPSSQWH